MEMESDLIDISGEDDSWLLQKIPSESVSLFAGSSTGSNGNAHFACSPLQIPRSNHFVSARPPFSSAEGVMGDKNTEQRSPSFVKDRDNQENVSGNKVELPKLSVERHQMKRKKKAAGYNLRKSLAWNRAFFTEEGVLDSVELSMITGNDSQTGGEVLHAIEEEQIESISALDSSSSPGLLAIEENLFKEFPVNSKNKGKKILARVLPKNPSPSKVPNPLAKKKVLTAQEARSGYKHSGCPRPLVSSSLKRPANAHVTKAKNKGLKVSKLPASGSDSFIPENSAKTSTQGSMNTKKIQPARSTGRSQETFGFASSSNKIPSAQTKAKSSLASKLSIPKPPLKQTRRNAIGAVSEIPSASTSRHSVVKSDDETLAKSDLTFPVSSNDHHNDSSTTAVPVPQSSCNSTCNMQSAIPRVPRPSGLRMPSPSVGFFAQSKLPSSHGSLGKGSQACNISTSSISYSSRHCSLIPTGKKYQVTENVAEGVNVKATTGNVSILGSTTGFSAPSRLPLSLQEKMKVDLQVTQETQSKLPSNPVGSQIITSLQDPSIVQCDADKRSLECAVPHVFEEISAEMCKELRVNDKRLPLCSESNEQENKTYGDKRDEKGKSCTLDKDQSGAEELKHGLVFKDLMDSHIQGSCDEDLKASDDYLQMKVSALEEQTSCTLEEDQCDAEEDHKMEEKSKSCTLEEDHSGAEEMKHRSIFKDSMDSHVQSSCGEELKPSGDYSLMKLSAQEEGNNCTLEDQTGADEDHERCEKSKSCASEEDHGDVEELKHRPIFRDSMNSCVLGSCDEELKPSDDYSQMKVSAQEEGNRCTLEEDKSGAGELKYGQIFRDSMDAHVQDSCNEELKPLDDYSQANDSAQLGGSTCNTADSTYSRDNLSGDLDGLHTRGQHLSAFLLPWNEDSVNFRLSGEQDMFVDDSTENVACQPEVLDFRTVDTAFQNSMPIKDDVDDMSFSEKQPSNAESVVISLGPVEGQDCIKSSSNCRHEENMVLDAFQGGHDMVFDDQATRDLKMTGEATHSIEAYCEADFIDHSPVSRNTFRESEAQHFSCQLIHKMQESECETDVGTGNQTTDKESASEMHVGHFICCPDAAQTMQQVKLAESCSLEVGKEDHEIFSELLISEESERFSYCNSENASEEGVDLPIKQTDQMEPLDSCSSAGKISAEVVSCSIRQTEENTEMENATETELTSHHSTLSPKDIICKGLGRQEVIRMSSNTSEKSNALGAESNGTNTSIAGDLKPPDRNTDFSGITEWLPKEDLDTGSVELNKGAKKDERQVETRLSSVNESHVRAPYAKVRSCEQKEAQVLRKSFDRKAFTSRGEESEVLISTNEALAVGDGVQPHEFTVLNIDSSMPRNTGANAENDKPDASAMKPRPNVVPFSDEWLAAIEAAGEEILTMKTGPVKHSPPEKSAPEPSPWSPVKRKNHQGIGPFDCTKYSNNLPPSD